MAASVLLTIGEQAELIEAIVQKASLIVPGQKDKNTMGPVIDNLSLDKIVNYIDDAVNSGAKLLLDGRSWSKTRPSGYWVGPTIILHSKKQDKALHEEVFISLILDFWTCTFYFCSQI